MSDGLRYEIVKANEWVIDPDNGYLRFIVDEDENEITVAMFPPGKWDYVLTVGGEKESV